MQEGWYTGGGGFVKSPLLDRFFPVFLAEGERQPPEAFFPGSPVTAPCLSLWERWQPYGLTERATAPPLQFPVSLRSDSCTGAGP